MPKMRNFGHFSIIICLFFQLYSIQAEASRITGHKAYTEGKYIEAYNIWKTMAIAGNAIAQQRLAELYQNGEGVKQSFKKSILWLTRSAQQNNHEAQIQLAIHYQEGLGILVDNTKALKWYLKAADACKPVAHIKVADYFISNKDYEQGYLWYLSAIECGHYFGKVILAEHEKKMSSEQVKNVRSGHLIKRRKPFYNQ